MRSVPRGLKAFIAALVFLGAGILSGCSSSGGCTVVSASTTVSGNTAQGPHCANTTTAGAASGYGVSGTVSGGTPLGVAVSLTGAGSASTATGANGTFSFTAVPNGNYTVTPSLAGYVFSPANAAITVNGADVSGINFTQSASLGATSGLAGTVIGAVAQNVTITLGGANSGSTTTNANGFYSFTGLAPGNYSVAPSLTGYVFTPASSAVATTSGANAAAGAFTASIYPAATSRLLGTVSGVVTQNVTITLSGGNIGSTVTDAGGNFNFSGLAAGSYTLTPSLAGYVFSPASLSVVTNGGDAIVLTGFTATQ